MNVAFKERPKHSGLPMPILPESRSSAAPGLPGQVPSFGSPTLRPTAKVIKKLTNPNSPQYDSSLCASALQQSFKTTSPYTGTVRGHDPQLSPTAVLPTVRDGKHTSSSPGHAPSSDVQSVNATRKPIPQSSSRLAIIGFSPTNNAVLCTENKSPSQTSPRTNRSDTRTPDLQVRRPRVDVFKCHVKEESPSPTVNANQTQTPTGVRSSALLGVSGPNRRPIILEGSRQPLAILSTRPKSAPRSGNVVPDAVGSTGLFAPNSSIVRSVTSQIGSLLSKTVLSITGVWQSSLSFGSWPEELICKGLSFAGKQLMSAKKGLQLYHMRTFWSA